MKNEITINNQNVQVKHYKGQRVVTFKDIDLVHNRANGTARRNFNQNKQHFIEGEDFFKIQPNEIRTVGIKSPNGGTVITESGYLLLVKSFTDDLSWEVQRQLVNTYFRYKEQKRPQLDKPYEYFDKTYNGEPVLTAVDIEHLTGISRNNTDYQAKHNFNNGKDYFLLVKNELKRFKIENPKVNRLASSIMIITKNGFKKLCNIYGVTVEEPKCFEAKVVQHEMPTLLNQTQTKELFAENCILVSGNDVIPYYKVVELLGEDAALHSKNEALDIMRSDKKIKIMGYNLHCNEEYTFEYFNLIGFERAVSYRNIQNIRKAGLI